MALWAILQAAGVEEGDEVVLPGYTCVAVPNSVLYAGGTPVYADIDPRYYTVTADSVAEKITDRTRVILAQATYGLAADMDPLRRLADRHGILLVEDCAQGLGGMYRGRANGTVTDAAFFSSQWSKPVSTGLGGIAYVRDGELVDELRRIEAEMRDPSPLEVFSLAVQLLVRPLERNRWLHYQTRQIYRWLTQSLDLIPGSSAGHELRTSEQPKGYAKRMSRLQRGLWRSRLARLADKTERRQKVAERYDTFFREEDLAVDPPPRPKYAQHGMLRYPVRVPNKAEFLRRCREDQIPIGDWFRSPLHPVEERLERWGYRRGECPEAERVCSEVVNLFTGRKALTDERLRKAFQPYL